MLSTRSLAADVQTPRIRTLPDNSKCGPVALRLPWVRQPESLRGDQGIGGSEDTAAGLGTGGVPRLPGEGSPRHLQLPQLRTLPPGWLPGLSTGQEGLAQAGRPGVLS